MAPIAVILPLVMAVVVFSTPSKRWRPRLLAATAVAHFAVTVATLASPASAGGGWLRLDAPGRLLLGVISVLFLCCAVYSVGYLRYRVERANRRFCACLLAALGTMSLVAYSQHLGLLWVGIEATTLATAPLIYFNRTPRSIEATWKYLVISSVGIALALFGSFFLGLRGAARRRRGVAALRRPAGRRHDAFAAVAAGGLHAAPDRLRHQDGPGADAHLEARRLRRGAGRGRGHSRRRHDELRLPGAPASQPDQPRRRARAPTPTASWW